MNRRRAFLPLFVLGFLAAVLSVPPPASAAFLAVTCAAVAAIVAAGLFFARRIGLGAPLLEAVAEGRQWSYSERRTPLAATAVGLAVGAVVLLLLGAGIATVTPLLQQRMRSDGAMPVWQRGLLAFEAGVLEELVFRLLILSLVVWALSRLFRKESPVAFWGANAVAALSFGAVHLPRWFATGPPGAAVVASVLAINGLPALVFGELYRRRGIEAAIISHFAADLVVHGAGPVLVS